MPIAARFTEVKEWLDELEANAGLIAGGLIRITAKHEFFYPSERITLIAGAVCNDMLIELHKHVGTLLEGMPRERVCQAYLAFRTEIEEWVRSRDLKVRNGWFVELAGGGSFK